METRPTILVPLDGSELSEAAVPIAADLAAGLRAAVTLLCVVPPVPPARQTGPAGDLPQLVDLEERRAEEILVSYATAFPGLSVECAVLVAEHAAEAIVDYVRQNPVDFVVMATHGRSGLRHLLAGSVTEAVVRSGVAPVVAVRPLAAAHTLVEPAAPLPVNV
jgi:universal stress protein A